MAAACQGWRVRLDEQAQETRETLTELEGDMVETAVLPPTPQRSGELLSILTAIAQECGDYDRLAADDSKFGVLLKSLKGYWRSNPARRLCYLLFIATHCTTWRVGWLRQASGR